MEGIKRKEELRRVVRNGRKLRQGDLSLTFLRNNDEKLRLCVIIPKKAGKAVKRNRIRRIIRETCRNEARGGYLPYSVVITSRNPITRELDSAVAENTRRLVGKLIKCSRNS